MMSKKVHHSSVHVVVMCAVVAVCMQWLCACSGNEMSSNAIVQCSSFTLTGDSLVEGSLFAYATTPDRIETNLTLSHLDSLYGKADTSQTVHFKHGRPWRKRTAVTTTMPQFSSGQMLVDALYNMSCDRIAESIDRAGRFGQTRNNSRLYLAIYLSLAMMQPQQSMATLRNMVDNDTIIMQREGQWPVVSDHIGWATAAWEVYKATGDKEWLRFSYRAIQKTLDINRQVLLDYNEGLMHGGGYASPSVVGPHNLAWMGYNDLFACMALGNNILTAHAHRILGDMGDELGIENEGEERANKLKDAINQHLWNEDMGHYCSFLYGTALPVQSPTTDNTSQAMCVLWNIADDDRAENLIAQTPITDQGVSVTYPPTIAIEPYFMNTSWATTQALWNLAAARAGNENALRRGLGALYRAQALYQSRGIYMTGASVDELGAGASNAAMALRLLAGIELKPEGIEFSPFVPTGMEGVKEITGLNYRRAVLDITVKGTGNDVASITDNDQPLEGAFLPCSIEGRHHIVITLRQSLHASQHVTLYHNEVLLPLTPTVVWSADSGVIADYQPQNKYRLVVNGEIEGALSDSAFALPDLADGCAQVAVVQMNRYGQGYMSRPLLQFAVTPQMSLLPDSAHAAINMRVAEGGDYLLDVGYEPTGSLDVRELYINTHLMGTVVMSRADEPHDGVCYSNMVRVKLLKGDNRIELSQLRLPKAFTSCRARHVRIIKQ